MANVEHHIAVDAPLEHEASQQQLRLSRLDCALLQELASASKQLLELSRSGGRYWQGSEVDV